MIQKKMIIFPIPKKKRIGLLKIQAGRILHAHEMTTITKLLQFGDDIFCQTESHNPGTKTADIVWKNEFWEIKYVNGNSRETIVRRLKKAKKQSKRIIIDISGSKISAQRAFGKIKDYFRKNKEIIKIFIISKEGYCIIDRAMLN